MSRLQQALLTLLVLGGVIALLWWRLPSGERAVRNKAIAHRELALRVLAQYLAERLPGAKAVIVSNPFTRKPGQPPQVYAFESAAVRGLKRGWGNHLQLLAVAFPELSPAAEQDRASVVMPPDATTPLSFLTADRAWDTLAQQYPEADLLVSLIGLPARLHTLEVWRRPQPRFALLLPDFRLVGDTEAVIAAFRAGKLVAAVLNKPGAPAESAATERDYRREFDRRFLLVTEKNCDEVLRLLAQMTN